MGIKSITLVGIALILLGIVAFAYQGISYTSREKIIDIWPHPSHRRHPENHPALPSCGGIGACRRDRVGRGWKQEIVLVRLRVTYHVQCRGQIDRGSISNKLGIQMISGRI